MSVMTENLIFIQALLAHLDQVRKLLGDAWPAFCDRLREPLDRLSRAEDDEQTLQAVDDIVSIGLDSPAADLCRALLNQTAAEAGEPDHADSDRHRTRILKPEISSVSRTDVITAGRDLAVALSSGQSDTELPADEDGGTACTGVAVGHDTRASATQGNKVVTRYTDIACPRRVWVETPRVSVVVRLTIPEPSHSAAAKALALREDLPVCVRIEALRFEIINDQEQEAMVLPGLDSQPLVFDLHPLQVGSTRITFDFFQRDNPVGTISVPVEITAQEISVTQPSPTRQSLRIEPNVQPPDLMLYVSYEHASERSALTFTLFRSGEVGRTFHPVLLQGDPQAQALRFYEQLTVLTSQLDPTIQAVLGEQRVLPPEDIDRRLKQFGQNLWRNLAPEDLKTIYAEERKKWHNKTLLIVSDEPYIPWELIWPYGQGWQDDAPWCATLRLTRWLRRDAQGNGHEAPSTRLSLKSLACLVPTDSGLSAAQRERQFLSSLLAQYSLTDVSPAHPAWSHVLDLLEGGGYDWLHIAAHGNFYPDAPDTDSAIWLQDQRPLTPDAFVGPGIEDYIRECRPGFVFNACHSGREGWALTRLGGWANRLISTGAGLFLGPLWTVEDQAALDFARTFYRKLLNGDTVAEAVHQGRLAARRPGDPTWLAYSVYAHPNAQVVF